ncbi:MULTISPECIES: hypothetical protein [Tenacibaculum]|uniref:hypothetical protein n=1 Tax=Tenacibaculum TaxID=104267 RepID=UPI0006493444|nr:hypothetical protein [Tenacibaculum mesophilum]
MDNQLKYLEEWKELASHGNFKLAENLYYDKLFHEVIDKFSDQFSTLFPEENKVLISMLGFSPEPLILTAKAVNPDHHFIVTTEVRDDIINRIEEYIGSDFELVILKDSKFQTVYKTLKEIYINQSDSNITLDITGGKKATVASAAIFGKDYRAKITYVDFKDYIKELRKPLPGTEFINIVYDPNKDQPELNYYQIV